VNDLNEIARSINGLLYDIKAEVIIADLIENKVNPGDIFFIPDGSFKRNYTHDILFAETKKLNNNQQVLQIHTSRDGLYDSLPEGLFHEPSHEKIISGKDMADDSKKLKLEEKEARNFFLPFESEIFFQRVNLELEERNLISQYSENLFNEIFPEFWNIDRTLPRKWVSRLILFLHYAHQIISDFESVAKCLEVIIEEKVKINRNASHNKKRQSLHSSEEDNFCLGKAALGTDTICGRFDDEMNCNIEFVIGPVRNTPISAFFEKGPMTRFLECFYGFFVPVEADVFTTLVVEKDDKGLVLSASGEGTALGYNTLI
jgi:hypothetical protein